MDVRKHLKPSGDVNKLLIICFANSVRENPENQVQKLKAAGFDACIMIYK